jgi:hypothetical protein
MELLGLDLSSEHCILLQRHFLLFLWLIGFWFLSVSLFLVYSGFMLPFNLSLMIFFNVALVMTASATSNTSAEASTFASCVVFTSLLFLNVFEFIISIRNSILGMCFVMLIMMIVMMRFVVSWMLSILSFMAFLVLTRRFSLMNFNSFFQFLNLLRQVLI